MRRPVIPLVLILLGTAGCAATGPPDALVEIRSRPLPTTPEALADELAVMVEIDQEARFAIMDAPAEEPPRRLVRRLEAIDRANTERMKRIVDELGWPTISVYGEKTAHDTWLLVQHADADPGFQRRCLDLMKPLLEKGDVRKDDFAYLTDRVLLVEGQLQIYGTQFHHVDGVLQPRPMVDPDNVDRRREEMGLVPLEEYKTWFDR